MEVFFCQNCFLSSTLFPFLHLLINFISADCRDVAEWLELLTAYAEGATVLGSIPASSDTLGSEGPHMKQCWIKYRHSFCHELYFSVELAKKSRWELAAPPRNTDVGGMAGSSYSRSGCRWHYLPNFSASQLGKIPFQPYENPSIPSYNIISKYRSFID